MSIARHDTAPIPTTNCTHHPSKKANTAVEHAPHIIFIPYSTIRTAEGRGEPNRELQRIPYTVYTRFVHRVLSSCMPNSSMKSSPRDEGCCGAEKRASDIKVVLTVPEALRRCPKYSIASSALSLCLSPLSLLLHHTHLPERI